VWVVAGVVGLVAVQLLLHDAVLRRLPRHQFQGAPVADHFRAWLPLLNLCFGVLYLLKSLTSLDFASAVWHWNIPVSELT
jgi:hypothetical protein